MNLFKLNDDEIKSFQKVNNSKFKECDIEKVLLDAQLEPIVGSKTLCIGNQVRTSTNKRLDILGLDSDGRLIVVELKRGEAPRDTIAQIIDYASWLDSLPERDFEQIARSKLGQSLHIAFKAYYKTELAGIEDEVILYLVAQDFPEEVINASNFLSDRGVSIVCVSYDLFKHGDEMYLVTSNIAGDTAEASQERSVDVIPAKREDKRFFYKLRRMAEDRFSEWLDGLNWARRDKFRLYQSSSGGWTAVYCEIETDEYTLVIEASLGRNLEVVEFWVWLHGLHKRDNPILESLLKEPYIVDIAEGIGMEVLPDDQSEPEARLRIDGWSDGSGAVREDFAEVVMEQIEKTKPLIEALIKHKHGNS